MDEVVEGGRENNWAVQIEEVEDGAREAKVRGLNHLSTPELEDGVDSEDDLK